MSRVDHPVVDLFPPAGKDIALKSKIRCIDQVFTGDMIRSLIRKEKTRDSCGHQIIADIAERTFNQSVGFVQFDRSPAGRTSLLNGQIHVFALFYPIPAVITEHRPRKVFRLTMLTDR